MIAWSSFSRVNCTWKFANVVYVLPKKIDYFQVGDGSRNLSFTRRIGGSKQALNAMDHNKKRRTVTSVWRPVSTQPNSYEGCTEKDAKTFQVIDSGDKSDDGFQVKGERLNTSGCNVDSLSSSTDTGPISVQDESLTLSSITVQSNDQSKSLEEAPALSGNIVGHSSQSQCNASELKSFSTICSEEVREASVHELDIAVSKVNDVEKYLTVIEVDASLVRFIKGKGRSKQKEIEGETGVRIIFPSSKKEGGIVIEGTSTENVIKASETIKVVLEEAIKSPQLDYSHFISLPLAIHPGLVDKLIFFQNSILGNPEPSQDFSLDSDSSEDSSDDRGDEKIKNKKLDAGLTVAVNLKVQDDNEHITVEIDDSVGKNDVTKIATSSILSNTPASLGIDRSIFIKPKTFHLTVLMLKLWNKERLAAATEVLQSISSKVKDALDGRPVFVRLKGLEFMKGSQAKARVLYAPVAEVGGEDRLSRACPIIDAYVDAGLVLEKDVQQKLKLHATLMNARHRKRMKRTRRYDSFDARDIYKQYGSEEWGEYLIREAHLSQRFAFDDKGYYHCCTSIPFPENIQTE